MVQSSTSGPPNPDLPLHGVAEKDDNRQRERHTQLGNHVPSRAYPQPIGDEDRNAEKNRREAEPESLVEDRSEDNTSADPLSSHRDWNG